MNEETLILQELKEGNKDLEWISNNYSDLQKDYSNKFIAVKNREIFCFASKLEDLINDLKKHKKDPAEFLIEFIYAKSDSLVV